MIQPYSRALRALVLPLLPLLLAACAGVSVPTSVSAPVPPTWQAALPHGGSLTNLADWWQQQGDPLLAELVASGQAVSPTVATSRSRIAQARSTQVATNAALLPALNAVGSASRGRSAQAGGPVAVPVATTVQAGLQAGWEIDVLGGRRASLSAADQRLLGADAQWHDARVSVAAEVASQYYALRSCRAQADIAQRDAQSRGETARLSALSAKAGFTAPAIDALARASAADARNRAIRQTAVCAIDLKTLVALTGMPEVEIELKMGFPHVPSTYFASISIASLPAEVLAQRPDVFSAGRDVAAASAEVSAADAARYPALSLSGSLGTARVRADGVTASLDSWSVGPLSLTVPLFDGGRRVADLQAAEARYVEAASVYRARVRQAVREVEEALVNRQSAEARQQDTATALEGFRASFAGSEALYKNGLASLLDLEDARRSLLAAEINSVVLQQERLAASVSLYRAAGGGWQQGLHLWPPTRRLE